MKLWCDSLAVWLSLTLFSLQPYWSTFSIDRRSSSYRILLCDSLPEYDDTWNGYWWNGSYIVVDTHIAHEYFLRARTRSALTRVCSCMLAAMCMRYAFTRDPCAHGIDGIKIVQLNSANLFSDARFLQFCVFDLALCRESNTSILTMLIAIINIRHISLFLFTAIDVE